MTRDAVFHSDDLAKRTRLLFYREAIIWAAIAIYLMLVAIFAWSPTPFAQGLAAIGFASAFAHCVLTYGSKNALALLAICLTVSFTTENIGAATGLVFGRYHFEVGAELPHVGRISAIVGGVWFGMGYFAWIVASTILDRADRQLKEDGNASTPMTARPPLRSARRNGSEPSTREGAAMQTCELARPV
jgi:putative membrane protein